MVNNIKKNINRYKFLYLIDFFIIALICLFPMLGLTSSYVSSEGNRSGYILEENIIVRQGFLSDLNNIEKISLMLTTIDKESDCDIYFKLLDEKNHILYKKTINNKDLSYTESSTDATTEYVNFYLDEKVFNTLDKTFIIELQSKCNSIIKVQYYDATDEDKKAIYDDIETNKKMGIRYSGTKRSYTNILYPMIIIILTLIVILGGKNDKK